MRNQQPTPAPAVDPEAIVDVLLKIPGHSRGDGWFTMDDILTATARFGIAANPATLLDALRELYRHTRVEHKRNGSQHAFRLANVNLELAQQDAAYIQNQLRLLRWTATGDAYYRAKAVPNAAFWAAWQRDRHYIKNRHLVVDHDENRKWTVYCFDAMLSDILLESSVSS